MRDGANRRRFAVLAMVAFLPLMMSSGPSGLASTAEGVAVDEGPTPKEGQKRARKPNRLAGEKSPYLLQHAYNPVDWYPWGAEAFDKARREEKPVFLSIGYSTCHWCHVMARESFEDEEIAAYLNQHFVAIKVDREERPDVDGVYMDAVTAITQHGGWPLSGFLTPEGQLFYGGTYFPARDGDRGARVGFLTILKRVVEVWDTRRTEVEASAQRLTQHLEQQAQAVKPTEPLKSAVFRSAFTALRTLYDAEHGGFRGPPRHAPKFPRTSVLDFLMRYALTEEAIESGEADLARDMVFKTLDEMIHGGIYDHLAGGFHRYSVDRTWLIPHFEKMLYDQALIARTLVDATRVSQNPQYLAVARHTLDYVLERMVGPEGELYSAEDADTNHVEGLTYTWRQDEVLRVLGEERGKRFCEYYHVTEHGNFEEGGEGANQLSIPEPGALAAMAKAAGMSERDLEAQLAEDRGRLLAVRDRRPQPLRDDKVLTAWNGLALSALSQTYQVSGDAKYLEAARRVARFVLKHMKREDRLMRRYREGEVRFEGFVNDYAFFVEGLLDLYESDFDPEWLESASLFTRTLLREYWDEEAGGFFSIGTHQEKLIARQKEFYDGAVPSGNSVAFSVLLRLAEFTGEATFRKPAAEMEKVAARVLETGPSSYPMLLCGAFYHLAGAREIVIIGERVNSVTEGMLEEAHRRFLPARILVWAESASAADALAKIVPLAEGKRPLGGKPTGYVCRQGVCRLPARDLTTFRGQLESDPPGAGVSPSVK